MTSFDPSSLIQYGYVVFFFIFMFYGQKIQLLQIMATIASKMKRLAVIRDVSYKALKEHLEKYGQLDDEKLTRLSRLITSIAIPPVSHLDPAGIVPKVEATTKNYEKYLKSNLRRIVGDLPQYQIENLTNSLEVAVELNIFYRVVEHFYKTAKKGGVMVAYGLLMALPQLMEMAEALNAASLHFRDSASVTSGLPIGDGFGPMVASKFGGTDVLGYDDEETTVRGIGFEGRELLIVKAKGPGGSVGNPAKSIEKIILNENVDLAITIDAGLRMESETTGMVHEGVGTAMGGNGTERFRIEEALVTIPVMTLVCKMNMKEAISLMPTIVQQQVEPTVERVKQMIREYSKEGQTVIIVGVGNTMGVN